MNKYICAFAVSILLTSPVFAHSGYQQGGMADRDMLSGMMMGNGCGMGPGMMMGGHGIGPSMMMGGGYGMGPGMMMGGYSLYGALKLDDKQQEKIQKIQEELVQKQWALMQAMHNEMMTAHKNQYSTNNIDVESIMKTQTSISGLHLKMLRNRLEAQKNIQNVLTEEQRERLREISRWGW